MGDDNYFTPLNAMDPDPEPLKNVLNLETQHTNQEKTHETRQHTRHAISADEMATYAALADKNTRQTPDQASNSGDVVPLTGIAGQPPLNTQSSDPASSGGDTKPPMGAAGPDEGSAASL